MPSCHRKSAAGLQRTRKENLVPIQQEYRVKRPDMHTDYASSHPDKPAAANTGNRDKIKPVDMVLGINHRFPGCLTIRLYSGSEGTNAVRVRYLAWWLSDSYSSATEGASNHYPLLGQSAVAGPTPSSVAMESLTRRVGVPQRTKPINRDRYGTAMEEHTSA